jgi:hypothetical protein
MTTAEPLHDVPKDGIRAIDAVLVPHPDAAYLVKLIDYLIETGKRQGAAPSADLVRIRNELGTSARASARADASVTAVAAQPVLHLAADAVVDTSEAAESLGITADAVRWHWRNGHLEGHKMGRQLVITATSVERLKARRDGKREWSA